MRQAHYCTLHCPLASVAGGLVWIERLKMVHWGAPLGLQNTPESKLEPEVKISRQWPPFSILGRDICIIFCAWVQNEMCNELNKQNTSHKLMAASNGNPASTSTLASQIIIIETVLLSTHGDWFGGTGQVFGRALVRCVDCTEQVILSLIVDDVSVFDGVETQIAVRSGNTVHARRLQLCRQKRWIFTNRAYNQMTANHTKRLQILEFHYNTESQQKWWL